LTGKTEIKVEEALIQERESDGLFPKGNKAKKFNLDQPFSFESRISPEVFRHSALLYFSSLHRYCLCSLYWRRLKWVSSVYAEFAGRDGGRGFFYIRRGEGISG
jgi:hypothetical protein